MISIKFHRFIRDIEKATLNILATKSVVSLGDLCTHYGSSPRGMEASMLAIVLRNLLSRKKIMGPAEPTLITKYYLPRVSKLAPNADPAVRLVAYIADYLTRCGCESFEDDIRATVLRMYAECMQFGELQVEEMHNHLKFLYGNRYHYGLPKLEANLRRHCHNPNVRKFLYRNKPKAAVIPAVPSTAGAAA